mgnify:FL=1
MIMVLSVFDFLVVITNHPLMFIRLVFWLNERNDPLVLAMAPLFSSLFISFSIMALLVMSIERYLGVYHPLFHRTSLTRRRLLTLIAVLFSVLIILRVISVNNWLIPYPMVSVIFIVIVFALFLFFNYKLFMISRKVRREIARRRNNTSSPAATSTLHANLNTISPCLMSVCCFLLAYIPSGFLFVFHPGQNLYSHNTSTWMAWTGTVAYANSTLNCLIFFWKNDVLRREGIKTVKVLKHRLKFAW